jgi:hypothetical protein
MINCPVCGKGLKVFSWYDTGKLTEWLNQCTDCNYMIHYFHGNFDLTIGTWRRYIFRYQEKKKADAIFTLFYKQVQLKKKIKNGENNYGQI